MFQKSCFKKWSADSPTLPRTPRGVVGTPAGPKRGRPGPWSETDFIKNRMNRYMVISMESAMEI
jgi:hypothetical protein